MQRDQINQLRMEEVAGDGYGVQNMACVHEMKLGLFGVTRLTNMYVSFLKWPDEEAC